MKKKGASKKRVSDETKIIGCNLARLRQSCGVSQRQVAGIIKTSFQQVQKYEKGQNRIPAEKLHHLKNFFGVPYALFFEGLPEAEANFSDHPEKTASLIHSRINNIRDTDFRQKLFKAFMILAS